MKYKLGDLGKITTGRTPKKNVDSPYGTEMKFLTPRDVSSTRYSFYTERCLSQRGIDELKNKIVKAPSVSVTCIGSDMGKAIINIDNVISNQQINSISEFRKDVDYRYVYYVLYTMKEELLSYGIGNGSTMPILNKKQFSNIEISVPDIHTQRKVVYLLSSLDSKIELNNQMIATLEELAATLFKRWFVDFEFPDENGSPYKSSGGKMVDSELGEIPEGWKVKKVGETVKIVRGASPRPIQEFMVQSGRPWVKISDANATFSPYLYSTKEYIKSEGISKSRTVESGTLILSNSATPGIPKIMRITASVHDGWLIFADYTEALYEEFMYLFLNKERESILQLSNGSVFRNLKTDILKNYPCVVPSEKVLQDFELIIKPVFKKIDISGIEIRGLSKIRNTLLPKLLSGEVGV